MIGTSFGELLVPPGSNFYGARACEFKHRIVLALEVGRHAYAHGWDRLAIKLGDTNELADQSLDEAAQAHRIPSLAIFQLAMEPRHALGIFVANRHKPDRIRRMNSTNHATVLSQHAAALLLLLIEAEGFDSSSHFFSSKRQRGKIFRTASIRIAAAPAMRLCSVGC